MKNFACASLLLASAALFVPLHAAAAPEPCDCALPIPPPPEFGDDVFGDTVLQPGAVTGTGIPTGRNVNNLTAPDGTVNLGDQAAAQDRSVSIPGVQGVFLAVNNGEEDVKGEGALDLAVGQDFHFEAGQFKQTANGIELCF